MKIRVKETGEFKTLSIINPNTGIDYIEDFLGNAGALMELDQFDCDDETESYICNKEIFSWWRAVVDDNQALENRLHELRELHGYDAVLSVIESAGYVGLGDYAASINQALDEKFGGLEG